MKQTLKSYTSILAFTFCAFTLIGAYSANAEDMVTDILPQSTSQNEASVIEIEETHPTIELTMDKSELIRLEKEMGSIVIGSSAHINVIADSADLLVVVPRAPGATHFSVLDKEGNVLMERRVIVAAPKEDYLRIKRTCPDGKCEDTSIYYCPDMCHEVGMDNADDKK